jgi:hypothetical protein
MKVLCRPGEERVNKFLGLTMISPELTNELQLILKEDYNIDLPTESVKEIGNSWVSYFNIITHLAKKEAAKIREEKGPDGTI